MTKKRKRYPDLAQKLERPWCYYCERDFDDLKILISHQKAKHFKCDRCGRRLNTAGGLSVHMNQVHKENLSQVENALPARAGLDIEIFGMEGVPAEAVEAHQTEVMHKHFEEEAERARITGNPIRGTAGSGTAPPNKRPRVKETLDEVVANAAQWRIDKKNGVVRKPAEPKPEPVSMDLGLEEDHVDEPSPQSPPAQPVAPPTQTSPFPTGQPFAPPPVGQFPPGQFPQGGPPGFGGAGYGAPPPGFPQGGGAPGQSGLPQRPPFGPPPGGAFPGQNGGPPGADPSIAASVDELISSAAAGAGAGSTAEASAAAPEKKGKKEKHIRLVYNDDNISPEEKIAMLPRYAAFLRT